MRRGGGQHGTGADGTGDGECCGCFESDHDAPPSARWAPPENIESCRISSVASVPGGTSNATRA
ncbi:hypothetical protein 33D_0037 [Mycobacterium phage 33D]|nr:hypothetical protein 33D_0037 [Mycobacterium phage 33D]